ncbi:stage III sporulation protein AF [Muricomes intestini]|jgi:stage III sporulation protein AF|uniref:Stage III sporulation protein AF n=1 Tax=Muricomes intestini TaxID=1796634 RepID=A0A4R3K838_9FIRM|nr:stage III sporulation protein AF [Muricomes intestini]TCS79156.1 stage III sporulation protein AF [Muricomes intestini]HAX51460.1 stage III sporulation protein AF [Lachnospiraceae bacterium]HCR84914.1 stage III sporulation protein AF [Lachnospiraceae bacterium]
MLNYLYEWIKNLAFFLVIVTAVLQVIPGTGYKKYVQFFSGMVMILLMLTPILKLVGMENQFYELYHSKEYELSKKEIEEQQKYFENLDIMDFLPDEYQNHTEEEDDTKSIPNEIKVEGIQVGE